MVRFRFHVVFRSGNGEVHVPPGAEDAQGDSVIRGR
jgi:hypothetical protein